MATQRSVGESEIRLMTRLSQKHNAINLSQGFPNEPPPLSVRLALAQGVISGVPSATLDSSVEKEDESTLHRQLLSKMEQLLSCENKNHIEEDDILNQYSPPMGRVDVREAIAKHYSKIYAYTAIDPVTDITITLGATEALASALRTIGKPGDKVVIFEPFHELYPSQCAIFYLQPIYVTLKQTQSSSWVFNMDELEEALKEGKILILNTPHNPTGKVFTFDELSNIVRLCLKHDVIIITDEIYEHMTYIKTTTNTESTAPANTNDDDDDDNNTSTSTNNNDKNNDGEGSHEKNHKCDHHEHICLPKLFPLIKDSVFICNSIGKSASATGWRMGWCIHPPKYTNDYRGIHDQLVVMSPHPVQYASLQYFLSLPITYFTKDLHTKYVHRIKLLSDTLRSVGFTGIPENGLVEGAYYLFVRYNNVPAIKDMAGIEAAMYMLQEVGVACVSSNTFYGSKNNNKYLRFAACRSLSDVEEGCRRIRNAFS